MSSHAGGEFVQVGREDLRNGPLESLWVPEAGGHAGALAFRTVLKKGLGLAHLILNWLIG